MTDANIQRLRALQPRAQDILLTLRHAVGQLPKVRSDLIGLGVRAAWLRVKIEVFVAQVRIAEMAKAPNEGVVFHHPIDRALPVQMDERSVHPLSGDGDGIERHRGALPGASKRKSSFLTHLPHRGEGS